MAQVGMPRAIGREFVEILSGKQLRSNVRKKVQKKLQILRDQMSNQGLATPNGAPISPGDIEQVAPHVYLAGPGDSDPYTLGAIPRRPSDSFTFGGPQNPPPAEPAPKESNLHTSVKTNINDLKKYFPVRWGKRIAGTLFFAALNAAGFLAPAFFITTANPLSLALAACGIGLLGTIVISMLAVRLIRGPKRRAVESINHMLGRNFKDIFAEMLLMQSNEKLRGALFKSFPKLRKILKETIENIQTAKNIIDRFDEGNRDTTVKAIDDLLGKFDRAQDLSFYNRIMEVREHMNDLEETERMLSEGVDYID